jgi:hypothetical protein
MTLQFWRPWIDPHSCGEGAQAERYCLRDSSQSHYLAIADGNQLIERVSDPSHAWAFHTHERAVSAAREISLVYGQPVDVVKLR